MESVELNQEVSAVIVAAAGRGGEETGSPGLGAQGHRRGARGVAARGPGARGPGVSPMPEHVFGVVLPIPKCRVMHLETRTVASVVSPYTACDDLS